MQKIIIATLAVVILTGCSMFNTFDKKVTSAIKAMDENMSVECRAGLITGMVASTDMDAKKKLSLDAIHKYIAVTDEYRKCYTLGAVLDLSGDMAEDAIRQYVCSFLKVCSMVIK